MNQDDLKKIEGWEVVAITGGVLPRPIVVSPVIHDKNSPNPDKWFFISDPDTDVRQDFSDVQKSNKERVGSFRHLVNPPLKYLPFSLLVDSKDGLIWVRGGGEETNPMSLLHQTRPLRDAIALAEAGQALIKRGVGVNRIKDEWQRRQIFLDLVLIERALDKIRVTYPSGTLGKYPVGFREVNKKLDSLRKDIWDFASGFNQDELAKALEEAGGNLRGRFITRGIIDPIPSAPANWQDQLKDQLKKEKEENDKVKPEKDKRLL